MIFLLPAIFVLVHSPSGDSVRSYEGQSAAVVQSLLSDEGLTGDEITQKQFAAFLKAHPNEATKDPVKAQAKLDLNSKTKSDSQRIDAIIKYLELDK